VEGALGPVLVVEPNASLRSLLKLSLVRAGFEVVACRSAWVARRELAADRPVPALVISELDLTPTDGFRLCEQLRSEQRTAHVPVILLGRAPTAEKRELAGRVGADELLAKPVYVDDVVALVRLETGDRGTDAGQVRHAETGTLPVARALRALLSGQRSGVLRMDGGASSLTFREGRVVCAATPELEGQAALEELLLFGQGAYSVRFGPVEAQESLAIGLRTLSTRLLPQALRVAAHQEAGLKLTARLVPDFRRLTAELTGLPPEACALVQLCDGFRTLREVIAEGPLPADLALASLRRLMALGILEQPVVPLRVLARAQRDSHPSVEHAVGALLLAPTTRAGEPPTYWQVPRA
jgi:DNA-binding response OmpR family regulator